MTKKAWLVIEKTTYGEDIDNYSISKVADSVEQATKFQIHLEALNDNKNKTYFLASGISTIMEEVIYHHNKSVEEKKPLILKDEVKDTSSEMPF